jgi:hypothetical protein
MGRDGVGMFFRRTGLMWLLYAVRGYVLSPCVLIDDAEGSEHQTAGTSNNNTVSGNDGRASREHDNSSSSSTGSVFFPSARSVRKVAGMAFFLLVNALRLGCCVQQACAVVSRTLAKNAARNEVSSGIALRDRNEPC